MWVDMRELVAPAVLDLLAIGCTPRARASVSRRGRRSRAGETPQAARAATCATPCITSNRASGTASAITRHESVIQGWSCSPATTSVGGAMSASRWDAGGSRRHRSGAPRARSQARRFIWRTRSRTDGSAGAGRPTPSTDAQLELDSDVDIATLPGFVGFVHEGPHSAGGDIRALQQTSTSACTRSRAARATSSSTAPPNETPHSTARSKPRWSSTATTSSCGAYGAAATAESP